MRFLCGGRCSLESDLSFNRAKWPRFERRTGQLLLDLIRPVVLIRCADFAGAMTPKAEFTVLLAPPPPPLPPALPWFEIVGENGDDRKELLRSEFFLARTEGSRGKATKKLCIVGTRRELIEGSIDTYTHRVRAVLSRWQLETSLNGL